MKKPASFSATDLCVKCGLCLPRCPTYAKTRDENESPRGRLALIQGWAEGDLAKTPELLRHLDNCLLCRACERACPASVPYGHLLDEFRMEAGKNAPPIDVRLKLSALRSVLRSRRKTRWLHGMLYRYRDSALKPWANRFGLGGKFNELDSFLANIKAPIEWDEFYPARGKQIGRVALFSGCLGEWVEAETITAAIALLTRLGFSVQMPRGQNCCGALDLHGGDRQGAERLAKRTLGAFDPDRFDAILSIASGCGAMLKEYGLYYEALDKAAAFSSKVKDINQFLAGMAWPPALLPKALRAKVYIHAPCSLKNVMGAEAAPIRLMEKIPGLEVNVFPESSHCCGAAGSYMLEHPEMARALRADLLERVASCKPDYLVTANVGCALHLKAGLAESERGIEVLHPVALLGRQLDYLSR